MDDSREFIRLEIDGKWSAEEFGRTFLCLSELYNLRLFLELLREYTRESERFYFEMRERSAARPFRQQSRFMLGGRGPWTAIGPWGYLPPIADLGQFDRLSQLVESEEQFEVRRVSYASPGFADLVGIGTVVGHLKEFVLKLIERHDTKRQRELSDDRAELENERIRIENARNFVALAHEVGYSQPEVRQLAALVDQKQDPLVRLIEHRKLRAVSTPIQRDEVDGTTAR